MNIDKLKGKFVENKKNVSTIAKEIGMSRSKLYRKLNKPELITIADAQKIKAAVPLSDTEAYEIFLAE